MEVYVKGYPVKEHPWVLHIMFLHCDTRADEYSFLEARFKRNKERIIQQGELEKRNRIEKKLRPRSNGKSPGSYSPKIATLLSSFKESDRMLNVLKESNQRLRCEIGNLRDSLFIHIQEMQNEMENTGLDYDETDICLPLWQLDLRFRFKRCVILYSHTLIAMVLGPSHRYGISFRVDNSHIKLGLLQLLRGSKVDQFKPIKSSPFFPEFRGQTLVQIAQQCDNPCASLVLCAAQPWSPKNADMFGRESYDFSIFLMCVGRRLACEEYWGIAFYDCWVMHVISAVIGKHRLHEW